ncbi:MAG: CAP domain-containing protein, partial [Patescibacteria group bacterium]
LVLKIISIVVFIDFPKNIFFADITRANLITLLNQERVSLGLQPLVENQRLDEAALLKAKDILEKDYFSHQSPEGVTPWYWFLKTGYNYKYAGENLAIGFLNSEDVYNAWLNSASHRENMINPNYREVGTAILTGNFKGNNTTVIVQLFGSPKIINIPIGKEIVEEQPVQPVSEDIIIEDTPEIIVEESNTIVQNTVTQSEVLSQISEYPVLKASSRGNSNTFYLKFLNFIFYNSDIIFKYIVYSLLTLIGTALLINILINFNIQDRRLILRSLIIIVLLSTTALLNKEIINQIIPYKIII